MPAIDPANPYGTLLPWPEHEKRKQPRARRVAGAWVGLADGRPIWYLPAARRQIFVFVQADEPALVPALRRLHTLPRRGRRLLTLEKINGEPAERSSLKPAFVSAGFVRDYQGLILDPSEAGR